MGTYPCLLSIIIQPCPPQRGTPIEPRGLAKGEGTRAWGWGHEYPSKAPGQDKGGV